MSICNVAILGENVNLEKVLPRLAEEGGFDCVSAIEFHTLEAVYNSEKWSLHLIAPDMPFFQNKDNIEFKQYIDSYLSNKAKRVLNNPSEKEFKQFLAHEMQIKVLITKCHY